MSLTSEVQVSISTECPDSMFHEGADYDFDAIICDLDSQINLIRSKADKLDYIVSLASGVLCAMLDILWVGDFKLDRGRDCASGAVDKFVIKTAKMRGCKSDDLGDAVRFLEEEFPLASDGNTPEFGGGLQHHLRDFSHHPTITGLMFSLLTQFTYKAYGTDKTGKFIVVDIPERSKKFIGKDVPEKIIYGSIIWFFHLVSDMAGSNATAGLSGGTGIPGPLLSLAKEISAIPLLADQKINNESLSVILSKLFNGTLLAKHDSNGKIIKDTVLKFDLRGELGIGVELGRQALPIIANECLVRMFYFLRRLAIRIHEIQPKSIEELRKIRWSEVKPGNNPTIYRMLTISTGVLTTIDIGEAILTKKYWIGINYVGVGRFTIALGEDISWCLKARKVKEIQELYKNIKWNTYDFNDQKIYVRMGKDMELEKLGLNLEQTEILYNIEYYKTRYDARKTKSIINTKQIQRLKLEWAEEWKGFISDGFSSFTQIEGAEIHWYSTDELMKKIEENDPDQPWYRLVLLEAMLFVPYFPINITKDRGVDRKYKELQNPINGYKTSIGDECLERFYTGRYCPKGYIRRLRKCYNSVQNELNEVLKTVITSLTITAVISIAVVATAGVLAAQIAVALVGTSFSGLSGAALTSACLAYLGGGAIAAGGAGMQGGIIAIVGGGAALGLGVGAGVGGAVGAVSLSGKKETIRQSAKLMVAVREIFLNDEHDVAYSNSILEKYVQNITEIEKGLIELRLKADIAGKEEKKKLKDQIKNAEESVEAMKMARKSLAKFVSSYEVGLSKNQ
ncbi:MAG: hypothetical protein Q4B01_08660 [Eubacteriales bacterium]|nr:hypothetical protein [Eubacteriales bacterium]